MEIWAHRGLSYRYPENTLPAFEAACHYRITGIELDIQLTKDGRMVVIHDETVDRTTNGEGNVCDYTLDEIKKLRIEGVDGRIERIPTIEEVLDVIGPYMKKYSMRLNIELKNSEIRYEGMEQMILDLIRERGLEDYVLYSSFSKESLELLQQMDPSLDLGVLDPDVERCIEFATAHDIKAIHPFIRSVTPAWDLKSKGFTVRVWNIYKYEPFFGSDREVERYDFDELAELGITDVFTNNADFYVPKREE